jgi:sugar lactone lactonase YvrE
MQRGRAAIAAALVALTGLAWTSDVSAARADTFGTTTPLAHVPYPNHPGGIAIDGNLMYVNTFDPGDRLTDDYDAIFTYDLRTGQLRKDRPNPIKVPRRMVPAIMGLATMVVDAEHRLYVADMNGRILRVDPRTGAQTVYAEFPLDTKMGITAMPSGICFDKDGNLYVTDGFGDGWIWKVPPGGGDPQLWLQFPLAPSLWPSGTDGVAIDPTGKWLYFSQMYENGSAVYRVPMDRHEASAVELVHYYPPPVPNFDPKTMEMHGMFAVSLLAFGQSGKLYVTLTAHNQVSVLNPDGTEATRFPSAEQNAQQKVPYDDPLGMLFGGQGTLLVADLGIFGQGQNSYVLKAYVGEDGLPLNVPSIP